jgi:hypothetical protein
MPAGTRIAPRLRFAFAPVTVFFAAFCLVSHAQPPESTKKQSDSKATPTALPVIKLPDGTFLWTGTPVDGNGGRVTLTLQEFQKLQEQIDQLKKQIATPQKPSAPSECVVRGRIEKRGEQLVGVLKCHYSFRTTLPQTSIALGGKKGFLVSAAESGNKLPILDATEDGFVALIEAPGDHTITIEFLVPITARGANSNPEIGFDIGLPRAPITTLTLEPPNANVKRINLTTRTPDPVQPSRPAERRILDIKQVTAKTDQDKGHALGPIDYLEITWEPPAAAAQPADQVQTAEFDISVLFTETAVETTAKIKLRGPGRTWRVVAPQNCSDFNVDRLVGTPEVGPPQLPTTTKPTDPNKPVWKIELPAGSMASDWMVTAVTRQTRAKVDDPKHRGPFPIGPFAVLDVFRQTGTVRVTAGPHTRFTFAHGLDLRQKLVPGPVEDDVSSAFFQLTTGPTGTTPPNVAKPLFTVEASPQVGSIVVKPTYKFTLEKVPLSDDYVWRIRAEIRVSPNHTTANELAIEIPAEWPEGAEASFPSESLPGVALGLRSEGFWSSLAAKMTKGVRVPTILHLPTGQKQAFDLILTAIVRVPSGTNRIAIPLPRFPSAFERDVAISATVPEGQEIRESVARALDGESTSNKGISLNSIQPQNTKPNKAVTSVRGESDTALSQVVLGWNASRPDITAEINADVTLSDRQTLISEQIRLKAVDSLPRIVRFRPSQSGLTIAGLKAAKGQLLSQQGHSEWTLAIPPETKEVSLEITYAIPHDRRQADQTVWNLPIGLLWPVGATQTDSTVHIWSNATTPRKMTNHSTDWRELTPEPVKNRDVIPSLVLEASGGEVPLVVEVAEMSEPSAVSVWVDRSSIVAWGTEDGTTHYRARYRLHKWLGPTVEIRLPASVGGSTPEFLGDGLKIADAQLIPGSSGSERVYRIPVDAFTGRNFTLEVRYQIPAERGDIGESVYIPVQISNAAFASPIRWQIAVPQGMIPLLARGAVPEFHWRLLAGGLLPVPVRSSDDDYYSDESNISLGDSVTARQASPAPIVIYRFPRNGFVILCSVAFFLAFLSLTRLPISVIGPLVALLSLLIGISAIILPHVTAQIAGACQPGLALAIVVLLTLAAVRSYYRHRASHLPGFARVPASPSGVAAPLPSSTRSRPSGVGSVSAAPVAPAGG